MNIDLIPNGAIKRVHVSQNDIGRTLTFNLFNNSLAYTIPNGATVKIQGTKPSGFGFSETCSVSGNTATIDTTEAMTDESGNIEAELVIDDGTDVLGTANFILAVEKNPHPSNTTDGTQITAQSLQDQIDALADEIESGGTGLSDEAKQALLNCLAHVAWIDEDGQDYYDALESALYPPANLVSISCVYTQSGAVYDTDNLDDLKTDLVVTAHYSNSSTATVTTYTLSGTLTVGTSTITVAYGGKTTTFNVTVSAETTLYPLENGTHTFSANSRVLTVSNGYHFEYEAPNATTSETTKGAYLNLSKVSDNDTNATEVSNVNLTTTLYTIPANASVRFIVKNIQAIDLKGGCKFAIALRNQSTSVVSTGEHTTFDDITVEMTTDSALPITCVFAYIRNPYQYFEADINLYVNNERWI